MKHLLAFVVVAAAAGCGAPPALVIALQVQEGEDINTSNVTGLLVRIGDLDTSMPAPREVQASIELETPPAGPTQIVVFACKGNSACAAPGAFVGCVEEDLQPSAEPVPVFVQLFLFEDGNDANLDPDPPPDCVGFNVE
ncbi:MAG: hypothetical protein Q8O67_30755 [Deltaproteobacteria bacterium]|nr:hypothetical protein [Deltaproteobacteria bacterium]